MFCIKGVYKTLTCITLWADPDLIDAKDAKDDLSPTPIF